MRSFFSRGEDAFDEGTGACGYGRGSRPLAGRMRSERKAFFQLHSAKARFFQLRRAALYRRAHLEQIGGFDELHFAYLEDVDIGYRAQIFGLKNVTDRLQSSITRGAVLPVRGTMRLR